MNPDDINKFDYDKVMHQLVKINNGADLYSLAYDSSNTLAKKFLNFENRITCVEIRDRKSTRLNSSH